MVHQNEGQDRVNEYLGIALQAARSLAAGKTRPKIVHRLRIHLRRIQAYLELGGQDRQAKKIRQCVSWLSSLRTLQVFERYLKRRKASKSDRRKVKARIRTRLGKLARKGTAGKIERYLRRHALFQSPISTDWVDARLEQLRRVHADALQDFVREATAKPKRKTLHALRLRLKTIRYQEEWALDHPDPRPELVKRIRRIQTRLGNYEERAEFRKLARQLKLKATKQIHKDWRQARQRARAVPHRLTQVIQELDGRRLRLVEP